MHTCLNFSHTEEKVKKSDFNDTISNVKKLIQNKYKKECGVDIIKFEIIKENLDYTNDSKDLGIKRVMFKIYKGEIIKENHFQHLNIYYNLNNLKLEWFTTNLDTDIKN